MGGLSKKWKRFWGAGEGRHGDPNLMRRANEVQWDPQTGRPIGLNGPPDQSVALEYQNRSNELIDQQRAARRSDALNFLRQGTSIAESYRPGGGAAMSAGLYGQMADTSLNIANNLDYVDMMAGYREHQDYTARKQQYRANAMRLGTAAVSAVLAAVGGPAGAAVGQQIAKAGGNVADGQQAGAAQQSTVETSPSGVQTIQGFGPSPAGPASGFAASLNQPAQPTAAASATQPSVAASSVGGGGASMAPVMSGGPSQGGAPSGGGKPQAGGAPGPSGAAAGGAASAASQTPYPMAQTDPSQSIAMLTHMSQTDDNFDAGILEMANSMLADLMGSFGGR